MAMLNNQRVKKNMAFPMVFPMAFPENLFGFRLPISWIIPGWPSMGYEPKTPRISTRLVEDLQNQSWCFHNFPYVSYEKSGFRFQCLNQSFENMFGGQVDVSHLYLTSICWSFSIWCWGLPVTSHQSKYRDDYLSLRSFSVGLNASNI